MSFYIEIPVMIVMFLVWKLVKRTRFVRRSVMDLVTDRYDLDSSTEGDGEDEMVSGEHGHDHHGFWRKFLVRSEDGRGGAVLGKLKRFGMWLFL